MISADAKIPIFALTRKAKTAPSVCTEIIKKKHLYFCMEKNVSHGGTDGKCYTHKHPVPSCPARVPSWPSFHFCHSVRLFLLLGSEKLRLSCLSCLSCPFFIFLKKNIYRNILKKVEKRAGQTGQTGQRIPCAHFTLFKIKKT
jgi:hypothetical protein